MELKSCTFSGIKYKDGFEICTDNGCSVCKNGEWEKSNSSFFSEDSLQRLV